MIIKVDVSQVKESSWRLFRQCLACAGDSVTNLAAGFTVGFSAILLPQLKADKTYSYNEEHESWIAASAPLSMALGCTIAGGLMDTIGRKRSHIIIILPFILGWLAHTFATTISLQITARVITGFCTGVLRPMSLVYLSEISDPKYRSTMLYSVGLMANVGMLVCHLSGGFMSWKTSTKICATITAVAFVIFAFLKESPLWLLSKGKTLRGVESFEWYRYNNEASHKELTSIIDKQKEKSTKLEFNEFIKLVFSRVFLKPLLTACFIFMAFQFSGINTLPFYAQDLLSKTFPENIDSFWFMISIDSLRTFSSAVLLFIAKRFPRRISFLVCNLMTGVLLLAIVVFLVIDPKGLVWLPITSMVFYMLFGSAMTSIGWSYV